MTAVKLFLCFLPYFFVSPTNSCSNDGYPYENYLSTKTPYRLVSNNSFERISYKGELLKNTLLIDYFICLYVLGCEPKKIWMMIRHGTRNPSDNHIVLMKTRLPQIRRLILKSKDLPNGKFSQTNYLFYVKL